jgi:hypothetical protein
LDEQVYEKETIRMQAPEIYEETIPFPLMKVVLGVFIACTLLFLVLLVYQGFVGQVGSNPAPNWFYLVMFLCFAGLTALVRNFNKLAIKISTQSVTVGFGVFQRTIPWDNVKGCYQHEASAIGSYGGWGIRMAKVKGKWTLVYNVIGCPTIVLELEKGRFKEFVFSTKNPDGVIETARRQILK